MKSSKRMDTHATSFIHSSSLHGHKDKDTETNLDAEEKPLLILILYVSEVSKDIKRVCCHFDIGVVFESAWLITTVNSYKG